MSNLLADFKCGPLDFYRRKASFDWKRLKVFLDTEDGIKYEHELINEFQKYPEFKTDNLHTPNYDDIRRIATRQMFLFKSTDLVSLPAQIENLIKPAICLRFMTQLSPSSAIKYSVSNSLFTNTVRNMGTERHEYILNEVENGNILGCYCLTEIGHGSNARGMRTTATFNKERKVFVLNSEDFEAAKCWAGGLGQSASYAVVYAQLVIDGIQYGLHTFVVPIRDPITLIPHPGVTVGDMGEKIGLNGIDNGFVVFDNYEIPYENLLNKLGDVTKQGKYVSPYKDPNKRHGAALGALSGGRVSITTICESLGIKALTIAIRYAAVRKQFADEAGEELPILEYQSHRYRLLPYLAAAFVLRNFNNFIFKEYVEFSIDSVFGNRKDILPDLGTEIHGISSACKPMAGWIMKDAIQESREACGGHGYLKVAGLGDVRNDHDANLTYEGENHVLIQQTSNWLLKIWSSVVEGKKIETPLNSATFLFDGLNILNRKFSANSVEELCEPSNIIFIYQWLVTYLMKRTNEKLVENLRSGKSNFAARNDSQVFYAKNMSIAFIQHFFIMKMQETILKATDPSIKLVLTRLCALYGLWSLEKHIPTLYQGEFAAGAIPVTLIQNSILRLCDDLKDDAVALVDVVAPHDFVLNSVLGSSDGEVYKRLKVALLRSPYCTSRPSWWSEITNWKDYFKSKL